MINNGALEALHGYKELQGAPHSKRMIKRPSKPKSSHSTKLSPRSQGTTVGLEQSASHTHVGSSKDGASSHNGGRPTTAIVRGDKLVPAQSHATIEVTLKDKEFIPTRSHN